MLFVAARELPKGASVEWQVTRHTGDPSWPAVPRVQMQETNGEESSDDDEDDETARVVVAYARGEHGRRVSDETTVDHSYCVSLFRFGTAKL